MEWADSNYFNLANPFRVHNHYKSPSWFERFPGDHPAQVQRMMDDVWAGRVRAETRDNADVERLLTSRWYPPCRTLLKLLDYPDRAVRRLPKPLARVRHRVPLS